MIILHHIIMLQAHSTSLVRLTVLSGDRLLVIWELLCCKADI